MISAEIIADSVATNGRRITTFVLSYPRFIHAEFMTHRAFSRNAASSRAIPAKRIRKSVREDPAIPIFWGANQKGMQAERELRGLRLIAAKLVWRFSGALMLSMNWVLEKIGLHKQIANRIIEPWFNIKVVCTATDWANFYTLRNHPAAQPEIGELARQMFVAHQLSVPKLLGMGEWHLPFVTDSERSEWEDVPEFLKVISVARCARVSYMNHDGDKSDPVEDRLLFERLTGEIPRHASPTEHQATPLGDPDARSGNLTGWTSFRKTIPDENITSYLGFR